MGVFLAADKGEVYSQSKAMNNVTSEFRNVIWDYLFRHGKLNENHVTGPEHSSFGIGAFQRCSLVLHILSRMESLGMLTLLVYCNSKNICSRH